MAPIKSSLARTIGKLLGVQADKDLSLRGNVQASRQTVVELQATGGTSFTDSGSKFHIFTSPGAFTVSAGTASDIEVLVVAGGGSGGTQHGGGGGGGTVVHATSQTISTPGPYTVTVGDGGGAASPPFSGKDGSNGGLSQFGSPGDSIYIISKGGGYGGGYQNQGGAGDTGTPGGTGGGASGQGGPRQGGTGTAPSTSPGPANTTDTGGKSYFNNGGDAPASAGGGGSGAGEDGDDCVPSPGSGGQGGDGQPFPSFPGPGLYNAAPSPLQSTLGTAWRDALGSSGLFAGGGGGAGHLGPTQGSPGGTGGGGDGAPHVPGGSSPVSDPGVDFTGGGGGGSGANDRVNGLGGKGIVIVKYTAPS